MKYAMVVLMLVGLTGCGRTSVPVAPSTVAAAEKKVEVCDGLIDDAVLRKVSRRFFLHGSNDPRQQLADIQRWEKWAANLDDKCYRTSYLRWLGSYGKDAEKDIAIEGQNRRLAAFESKNPTPVP